MVTPTRAFATATMMLLPLLFGAAGCSDGRRRGSGVPGGVDSGVPRDPTYGCWNTAATFVGEGCGCGREPPDDLPPVADCSESGIAALGGEILCCQSTEIELCRCNPIRCGTSAVSGNCVCGAGLARDDQLASCTPTAADCCASGSGHCYCEDECFNRFASYSVSTCDVTSSEIHCPDDYVRVASCN